MVSSRNRLSAGADSGPVKVPKPLLEEWTTKEKLCLASLAIKYKNAWNSIARNMQGFSEKERPDGWSNQKTCAAQFDKLMNELGVDKRPKRNEPSDGNSSSVIYKKMAEKRARELEESTAELRKTWMALNEDLEALENGSLNVDRYEQLKQKIKPTSTTPKLAKTGPSISSEIEKPPTRALTRRESSRQNLERTLAVLCKEAADIKALNLLCKPSQESDRELYDKVVLKHMDISIIRKRLGGEVEDPYAVLNDLLLMFQNATMFYPPDHMVHKTAIELREKMVPQWEKALLDKSRFKH